MAGSGFGTQKPYDWVELLLVYYDYLTASV